MRVCVFCGSSPGNQPEYREIAQDLGRTLAQKGVGLVYGGADVGLMGMVANSTLEGGGEVIGVIPRTLIVRELAHHGLTDLRVVDDMQERKDVMARLSSAFVCLPGGYGTLDEMFEMVTWNQLGEHAKPCILLNINGFYDDLLTFLDKARDQGFIKGSDRDGLTVVTTIDELFEALNRVSAG
ncbi:MAG: TIGR00730 family Rossman fold protein [Chromatiales bacterium]|nr:TIGR00730 family Rossman fold protein [Chromatiales bacterium]